MRFTLLLVLLLLAGFTRPLSAADYLWIEAEKPDSIAGLEKLNTWSHEYFSGEWVHISIDADKIEADLKADAIVLKYEFESAAGEFEIWNRVGFEYVRSPFEWRVDGGEWTTAKPDDLTIDLMEVGFWCEIAWLKLGEVKLEKGKHTLEIRLSKRKNAEGKPERILYASDSLCVYSLDNTKILEKKILESPFINQKERNRILNQKNGFQPYSKFKPDEDHRAAKDKEAAEFVFGRNSNSIGRVEFDIEELKKKKIDIKVLLEQIKVLEINLVKDDSKPTREDYIVHSLRRGHSLDSISRTNLGRFEDGLTLEDVAKVIDAQPQWKSERVPGIDAANSGSKRKELRLSGTWEICRDDEYLPEQVIQPISRLPKTTRWSAITVPGDKNELRPDLMFAHRVWYRARFHVPLELKESGFFIEFPQNNLNTTVYLNGSLCGFNKNPFAKFEIDITQPIIYGGTNEILVGIRDAWYARTENPDDPMKLRKTFNYPKKFFGDGFQDLVYPIWNHPHSGILLEPRIVATGPVYVSDVFIKPSLAKKELELEITVQIPNATDDSKRIKAVITDCDGIEVKSFEATLGLSARDKAVVRLVEKWDGRIQRTPSGQVVHDSGNPKLWSPENPYLYGINVMILDIESPPEPGKAAKPAKPPVDSWYSQFGFREWSIEGKNFMLNGVPFHGWADTFEKPDKEQWLEFYRNSNQRMMRFWGTEWKGMAPNDALNFFDENGVVVRRSGIFDGQAIGYNVIENDPDLRAKNKAVDPSREQIKMDLFANWRDQMLAQVRAERNHPSIMLWSLENEILYINCVNLYGGLMDQFEDEIIKTANEVKKLDPTRPSMVDGGGATKRGNPGSEPGDGLEVHGDHYVFKDFSKYPDRAYEPNPVGGGHGNRWIWDEKRPRFIGEDFYVNGFHPSDFAIIGGEEAFSGRTGAKRGVGIMYKMLTEGYRWAEYGAWQFWVDQNRASDQYSSNAPIAVFCREWDWSFQARDDVKRSLRIFNDHCNNLNFDDRNMEETIRFTYEWDSENEFLNIGRHNGNNTREVHILPGKSLDLPLTLRIPDLAWIGKPSSIIPHRMAFREDVKLHLKLETFNLKADAWEVAFRETKEVTILDNDLPYLQIGSQPVPETKTQYEDADYARYSLYIYDPGGEGVKTMRDNGFHSIEKIGDLNVIPKSDRKASVLIVWKDALKASDCDSPALLAFASQGGRVIVLEQKFPLRYGALPCEIESAQNEGRTAFIENTTHPIFKDLKDKDFFTWADGHVVYRDAYKKPTRGARSLLQCGNRLENSGIVEIPVGKGVMILSQTLIAEKHEKSVVARKLLANMLEYAEHYKLSYTPVMVCIDDLDDRFQTELNELELKYRSLNEPSWALMLSTIHVDGVTEDGEPFFDDVFQKTIIILPASQKYLKALLEFDKEGDLKRYFDAGGIIFLHGLAPEGLEDFNKIVGIDHIIRPFGRERVAFPAKRHPLTLGLSLSDIAMSSGERMFGWANDEYVASDTYTYAVDLDDIAPFAKYENDFVKMMSNGMLSADGWPYIVNVPAPDSPPLDFSLKFPKKFDIEEVTWTGNTFYYPVTKFGLIFDGNESKGKFFNVEPTTEPQTFPIEPPISGQDLKLRLAEWTVLPDKGKVTGLDDISLKPHRSAEFHNTVKPLLNIGTIVHYQKSTTGGGLILCNINFKETETVLENAVKKRNILATILRNLGAEFTESQKIVPGMPLEYSPVEISKQCNEYREEKGWFGEKEFSFAKFPRGKQKFAGIDFDVYDFPTSPVPNCIITKNEPIKGIELNRKADALFFLQTAKIDRRLNRDEIRDAKTEEMFKYIVRYSDGTSAEIPILAELDIEDYKRKSPEPISGARLAWVGAFARETGFSAVAYIKQWDNPNPELEIRSLEIVPAVNPPGRSAILAITAANAK